MRISALLLGALAGFSTLMPIAHSAHPTQAAHPGLVLGVNTGMSAQDSTLDLQQKYKPLANYIGEVVGQPVHLLVSQSIDNSERRLKRGSYDFFLGPPHTVAEAQKRGDYTPIVRYQGKIRGAFVVMESSGINKLADIRGKRLGLPDETSLPALLAKAKLKFAKIDPASSFSEVLYQKFQDEALSALKIGRVDVVVVTSGFAKKWVSDNPGSKIIDETYEVPHFALASGPDVDDAMRDKVQRALINATETAKGKAMLEALGKSSGFISTNKEEFSPIIRLFGL
jgi:ABC-type phosphate/phosphonate transport system substrate-binding protein